MQSCGCSSVGDLLPLVSELSEDNLMVTTQLQSGCIGVTFFLWSVNLVVISLHHQSRQAAKRRGALDTSNQAAASALSLDVAIN